MKCLGMFAVLTLLIAASCGYHVGGRADLVPKNIQTIAIPAFGTLSTRYKLVDQLPQQIGREMLGRTRLRIVDNASLADAVLNGSINSAGAYPTVLDPATSKATSVQVNVNISVRLVERLSGRTLYARSNWNFRENYDLAVDPHQFFDESGPALDRLSRDVARDLVSSIVENF
jgi:Lipopolysaccharide-assembly